jgi:hypothetical protein
MRIFILIILILSGCGVAEAKQEKIAGYSINQWVDAIRKAEGNDNYGILSIKCTPGEDCRKICANTVRNNYKRWIKAGKKGTYLLFLANRYCPIGASNDPSGLNRHWPKNVKYFLERG